MRTPEEREGDLNAQIAACHTGAERLLEIAERYGLARVQQVMDELQEYSEKLMRAFLSRSRMAVTKPKIFWMMMAQARVRCALRWP